MNKFEWLNGLWKVNKKNAPNKVRGAPCLEQRNFYMKRGIWQGQTAQGIAYEQI